MAAPRPILIFAGGLGEARRFADDERLSTREWVFVRDPAQARGVAGRSIAVLAGFERNPRWGELHRIADRLLEQEGPYVPRDVTLNGRTAP